MKLMKYLIVVGIVFGVYFLTTKDNLKPVSLEKLSEEVNLDLTKGTLVSTQKDRGFEDGIILYEIQFSRIDMNDLLNQSEWKELYTDGLLTGIYSETIKFPSIDMGYYSVIENENSKMKILMYDLENEKLYYYKWY